MCAYGPSWEPVVGHELFLRSSWQMLLAVVGQGADCAVPHWCRATEANRYRQEAEGAEAQMHERERELRWGHWQLPAVACVICEKQQQTAGLDVSIKFAELQLP